MTQKSKYIKIICPALKAMLFQSSNANRNTLVIQSHYRNCGNVSPPRIAYHVPNGINVQAKPTPAGFPFVRAKFVRVFVTNELKISGLWFSSTVEP